MTIQEILLLIQFLTGAAVKLYQNDHARANQIKTMTIAEILDLAKVEAERAKTNADDLAGDQGKRV